jgi:hypothetical protein
MRYTKFIIIAILLSGLGLTGLKAQDAISVSGGDATGTGGSASFSIGQVVYTTNTGPNGSVAQGVQQPYEISVVTEVEKTNGIELLISAFPNPTTSHLTLNIENPGTIDIRSLSYQLFDLNGTLLETTKVNGDQTIIEMNNRVAATYFLSVTNENKTLKTFKIIKAL